MRIADLDVPAAVGALLASEGYEALYPPQEEAVRAGALAGGSVLVSAPTASGKTLIATLAIAAFLSRGGGRAVYLSPLRALASEKHAELRKLEGAVPGARAGLLTGEGRARRRPESCSILVATNEAVDSAMRRGAAWASEVGLVVADEVHLIGEEDRGPTLEMVLTRLMALKRRPQIIGLSATVTNSAEIAKWLGCRLVSSSWRPVPLAEGVCAGGEVAMDDGREFGVDRTAAGTPVDLGVQCVEDGGQALIFASTRPRSRALATKAVPGVSRALGKGASPRLAAASKKILAENEHTDLVKALADLVKKGVAFHHAGLSQSCRSAVEAEFRSGRIRLLASTPTLAAGVNLPARRVVISSMFRYDARRGGNAPISVLEYKQLCGRAGRPQYDELGEAILVDERGYGDTYQHYVDGKPEPIKSKIIGERALRAHALGAIASEHGITHGELLGLFRGTLGGRQHGGRDMELGLEAATEFLVGSGLAAVPSPPKDKPARGRPGAAAGRGGRKPARAGPARYAATNLGRAASTLYIDPETAVRFHRALARAPPGDRTLEYLHLITSSAEFFPRFALRQRDYDEARDLLEHAPEPWPISLGECTRSLLAMHAWVSEWPDIRLSERLGVESGDMHRMRETGARLAYCLREIARVSRRADLLGDLEVLRARIAAGIRAELVPLAAVRGVGRVRARRLYRAGIRDAAGLRRAPLARLAGVDKIGPALAARIKADLGRRG